MRLLPLALLCVPFLAAHQDPDKRKPTSRRLLPPVAEPFRTKVERKDLLQKFAKPSPLEGFYRLREVVVQGATKRGAGYLYFGRTHCTIQTAIHTVAGQAPFLQSSVRTYRVQGDQIVMSTLTGHDYAGGLRLEQPGMVETRRFQRAGTMLRVFKSDRSYMEFVRVE